TQGGLVSNVVSASRSRQEDRQWPLAPSARLPRREDGSSVPAGERGAAWTDTTTKGNPMTRSTLAALVLGLCNTTQAAAQATSLTAPDAEVWSVVEQVWQMTGEDRLEEALSHYHPDWHRWGY